MPTFVIETNGGGLILLLSILQYVQVTVRPLVLVHTAASHSFRRPTLLAAMTSFSVFTHVARTQEVPAFAPAADALPVVGGELDDHFGLHGQPTWAWQAKPAFKSPYSGDNSLTSDRVVSYSLSTTLDLGMQLWKGAGVHFNPEVVTSKAFSGLHGFGGPANGGLAKVAGTGLTLYRTRVSLRQIWGLGSDTEKVDADFNQFADVVDKRGMVLTMDNLPTPDVLDTVEYAHDPRTQFLNQSFMTHPSFDYAVDARGYSQGLTFEHIDSELGWAVRVGRFLQPVESNGSPFDTCPPKHCGDMLELEESYTLLSQEGKVCLLGR